MMQIFTYRKVSEFTAKVNQLTWDTAPDPSPKIFIVPTRDDMELLKDMLLGTGGMGISFPEIYRWGDLFGEIKANVPGTPLHRRQIDPPDHWLIVRYILEKILDDENFSCAPPGIRQKAFTSRLGDSLRELLREEIDPAHIAASLRCPGCSAEGKCRYSNDAEGVLCKSYHDYYNYLRDHGLCDSAQISTLTREIINNTHEGSEWTEKRTFIFTGFLSFNHSQLELVRTLCDKAREVIIFTPLTGMEKAYTVLSQFENISSVDLEDNSSLGVIPFQGGDKRLELETIARELIFWNQSVGEIQRHVQTKFPGWGNISMNCPGEYIQQVEETFYRYGIPFALREGLTVAETPSWEIAVRAWDCIQDDWPLEKTARLLKEPCFCGDRFPVEKYEKYLPSGEAEWCNFISSTKDPVISGSFESIRNFGKALRKGGTAESLLKALRDLFSEAGSEKKICSYIIKMEELDEYSRRMNAAFRETEEKLTSISELLGELGPAGNNSLKGGNAFEFLKRWARTSTIWNAPSKGDSVEVYPGTPPVLSRNKVWIFAGASSRNWPGTIRETALLPDSKKEILHSSLDLGEGHLPLVSEQRRQKEYLFRRIMASGNVLTILSWPGTDISGKPLPPSPFLERSCEKGKTFWASNLAGEKKFITRGMNRLLPLKDDLIIRDVEIGEWQHYPSRIKDRVLASCGMKPDRSSMKVSLSSIDDWIECPFLYYCRHILKIEPGVSIGYDSMKAGIALHKIWEETWKIYNSDGDSLRNISGNLLNDSLKNHYPELLTRASLTRHLAKFKALISRGGTLQDEMEQRLIRKRGTSPLMEGEIPELEIDGVVFRGRFDRLDILENDNAVVIDYKSGESTRFRKSMQLAAYSLLIRENPFKINSRFEKVSGYGYISHSDGKVAGASTDKNTAEYLGLSSRYIDLDKKLVNAEKCLTEMAGNIVRGEFIPDYNSGYCRYCPYSGICRRQENPKGDIPDDQDGH